MGNHQQHLYQLQDEVRDNEADLAGVVNHAHYLNYMANARHKHLRLLGLDFQEMLAKGYMLVATKIEIRYRLPLFVGDQYQVHSELKLKGKDAKFFTFEHRILRFPDGALAAKATVQAACVNCETNKADWPDEITQQIKPLLEAVA